MKLLIGASAFDGKYLWCQGRQINIIFAVDITDDFSVRIIGELENSKSENSWDIGSIVPYRGKVYFFSSCEYEVWVLNTTDYSFEHNVLSNASLRDGYNVALIKDSVWLVPRVFSDKIIQYNLISEEVTEYDWNRNDWDGLDDSRITKIAVLREKAFFTTRKRGSIILIILNALDFGITGLPLVDLQFVSCIYTHNQYINILGMSNDDKPTLIVMDQEGKIIRKEEFLGLEYDKDESYDVPYLGVLNYANKTLFIANHAHDCYLHMGDSNSKLKKLNITNSSNYRCSISNYFNIGEKLYLISGLDFNIKCLDMKNDSVTKIELIVNDSTTLRDVVIKKIADTKLVVEDNLIGLDSFILLLNQCDRI